MKLITILASLAAIGTASAAPAEKFCLSDDQASVIVSKFASVLEGASYQGQNPNKTALQVVARNYVEYSDSILSLEGDEVSDLAYLASV